MSASPPPTSLPPMSGPAQRRWSRGVARVLSIGLHPFAVAPALAVLTAPPRAGPGSAAAAADGLSAAVVGGAVVLLLVAPMGALTWWQVRRGVWETVDASRPRDRPVLFGVALGALLALGFVLALLAPTSPVTVALPWVGALVVSCGLVTRWVKLSLHLLVAALAAVALRRHRWSEVLVGTAVGVLAGLLLRHVA